MLRDQVDFLRGLHTFYDLLCGPGAVLVDADHRQMRANTVEHGHTGRKCALLEELLDHLYQVSNRIHEIALEETHCVTQPVRRKIDNLAIEEISGDLFDFFIQNCV